MKTENLIAIFSGIVIPIVLFLLSKDYFGQKFRQKKYLLSKFLENKQKIEHFTTSLEHLLQTNNSPESKIFPNSDITYLEYLNVMKLKYESEYSSLQYSLLKKKKLSKLELQEYIEKLKIQEDSLNKLILNLDLIKAKYS
ncbi:hypothetical protein [Reichenbachiella sp. MALMAid0571]|uniref:hypothetical protein n=1 Tax=Reichenbachiella sp. MALMAid0571 TaxID=3143939 RepID=UPI0032DF806E